MFFEVKNLSKSFGDFVAVNNVSIGFERNKITAIIGPNGAGKTTFVNLCSGYLKPSSGDIYFAGKNITKHKIHQRANLGIARTFQIVNIFQGLSVMRNVKIPLLSRKDVKDIEGAIINLLCSFELDRIKYSIASEISHGDQRLLEMCMALALKPKLLFLDEPLAGINPADRGKIIDKIFEMKNQGITIIFIEHDIESVLKMADEIIVMHRGEIIAKGGPDSIKENEFVRKVYLGGQ